MKRVVGIGAGGHAHVIIEILRMGAGEIEIVGLVDRDKGLWNKDLDGVPVLGGDDRLPELYASGVRYAFVGVGRGGSVDFRRPLYELARTVGFEVTAVVHPRAVIASSAELGDGVTVFAAAVVNTGARLGQNVLVNTAAVVEHHCVVGDHVHVASGAVLCGDVHVGESTMIGAGAVVRQGVRVGAQGLVAAGAVVVDDVPPGTVVAGVPARPLHTGTGQR